jgi:uncharacterized membrane protein YccC
MPSPAAPLRAAVRSATRVDRSKIAVDVGARAAMGVALCLVVGRLSGHTLAGVTATIGALNSGMASHQGTYRSRAAVVMAAAAASGVAAAIGATIGHLYGPDIAVTAVVGFAGALLVCLGPAAAVVGLQAVVGLIVFSQFDFPWPVGAREGGLVLLGGAVQALLVVLLWPLRRFPAERRALRDAFGALARYARAAVADPTVLPELAVLDGLQAVWRDTQPFGGDEIAAHRALAAQADRLRLELVAVVRARSRLKASGEADAARTLDQVLDRAAAVLEQVADAIGAGRPPSGWEEERIRFRSARQALHQAAEPEPGGSGPGGWASAAASEAERRVDALAGQLRAVLRTAAAAAGVTGTVLDDTVLDDTVLDDVLAGDPGAPVRTAGSGVTWVRERLATLRSNLTLSSQSCRHALRTSVTLGVAVAVSHAFPYAHRYWLPLTSLLVLRPDFGSTITRGVSRVLGTLVGAGVVTLLLAELRLGPDWLIALVIVLCFGATTLVLANYALFSVFISSLVVTLLAFIGNPEVATAGERTIYTLAGAALALAAYLLWPTWEGTSLPETLAGLAETEGRYAGAVLRAWADPAAADRDALQKARHDARLTRSNAEAAVARWINEPRPTSALPPPTVLAFMAAIRNCVRAVIALHAELPAGGPGQPEAAVLGDEVEEALSVVADQVKGTSSGAGLPPLRKEQLALAATLPIGDRADSTRSASAVVLAGETDLLVDSIDAIGHLLGLVA